MTSRDHRTLYLHIGPHKTATTYVQQMFFEQRLNLLHYGVDYPEEGIFLYGHHGLANDLLNGMSKRIGEVLRSTKHDRVLLSSENFDKLTEAAVDRFFSEIPPNWNVKVIYALRRPDDLLVSTWKEEVKHGSTAPLSHFLFVPITRPSGSPAINHTKLLKNFASFIRAEDVIVFSYDGISRDGEDVYEFLLREVLSVVGLNGSRDVVNGPWPTEKIEIARALNIVHHRRTGLAPGNMVQETFARHEDSVAFQVAEIADHVRSSFTSFSLIMSQPISEFCDWLRAEVSQYSCVGPVPDKYSDKFFSMPDPNWMHYGKLSIAIEQLYDRLMLA